MNYEKNYEKRAEEVEAATEGEREWEHGTVGVE